MTTISTLASDVTVHHAANGSADIVLARRGDRMMPLFRYRRGNGTEHAVVVSEHDVTRLMNSMITLFAADQPQVTAWWRQLTAGKDNRET